MAGLQMDFEEEPGEGFRTLELDGYHLAVEEALYKDHEYLEIKYSDNFLVKGFYVSHKK